jgi:hypothetical protein
MGRKKEMCLIGRYAIDTEGFPDLNKVSSRFDVLKKLA